MTKLGLAPSEFWRMAPRHFWWMLEAQAEKTKRPGLQDEDRARLKRMLTDAKKGLT